MKKILIYNFSGEIDDISCLFPNDRLAQIASTINSAGFQAEIWDKTNLSTISEWGKSNMEKLGHLNYNESFPFYDEYIKKEAFSIAEKKFDLVLLNLWQGSGFKFSLDLARKLNNINPYIQIIGIGQKVDWFSEKILNVIPELDGIIIGLEHNTATLLASNTPFEKIPNLIFKKDGKIINNSRQVVDPNSISIADYSENKYSEISYKIPLYEISLSNQACPNNCTFCVRPGNYGKKIIKRDIKSAVSEMSELIREKKARVFRMGDSTPPRLSLTEFAQEFINQKLNSDKIHISSFSRIDINREEDFSLLRKAGIESLFFGVESLCDESLKRMKKGTSYEKIKETIKRAHSEGIFTVGSFIFPFPEETEKSMNITLDRINEMKEYLDSVLILPGGVYPVTEWGQNPEKYGIHLDRDYVEKMVLYPIKYLIPMELWPDFPFSYKLFEKSAEDVSYKDILNANRYFTETVRKKIGIPGIPDYYYTLARALNQNHFEFTKDTVKALSNRDYAYFEKIRNQLTGLK
ncbi:MAG: radical SAM protein [Candidatus Muiribacteriota bacterium]